MSLDTTARGPFCAPIDTQRVMKKITADQQGGLPPPADSNRNGRPTSIGMGGRHQLECPADIVGTRSTMRWMRW
jgi:hypothetical protein